MKQVSAMIMVVFLSLFAGVSCVQKAKMQQVDFSKGNLQVAENGRFLVYQDGTPFFFFADTAWQLFHRLTREEIEFYFQNRAEKGFTVIQAVILAELDGLQTPNRYGVTPLLNDNPETPDEAWFEWVDEVLKMAEKQGLYIALVPTWGDKVDKKWGTGPEKIGRAHV